MSNFYAQFWVVLGFCCCFGTYVLSIQTKPIFAPFVDNGSHCCSLKSRILKNAFTTFSRLIDANEFVSLLDSFETF